MPICFLSIQDFRNISSLQLEFAGGLNVLEGRNAEGKTNLIEAIYYLANGHSFRSRHLSSLISFDQEVAQLHAQIVHQEMEYDLKARIVLEGLGKKEFIFQDKVLARFSKIYSILRILLFTPDSVQLFRAAPGVRRKYFDQSIQVYDLPYGSLLSRYIRVVRHRNQLLEAGSPKSYLVSFDVPWAMLGLQIMRAREKYLQELIPIWSRWFRDLSGSPWHIGAKWVGDILFQENLTEEKLLGQLAHKFKDECYYKKTLLGPHLDDLHVVLDGRPVKEVASQGQHRMLVIALKLSEAELFNQSTGRSPVFLLDDLGSELDPDRQRLLLDILSHMQAQTFLTSAQVGAYKSLHARTFYIERGGAVLT